MIRAAVSGAFQRVSGGGGGGRCAQSVALRWQLLQQQQQQPHNNARAHPPPVCAGKRHRFREGDFDLDLAYITPRLVAMAYPGSGVEGMYRNSLTEVARFLNSRCVAAAARASTHLQRKGAAPALTVPSPPLPPTSASHGDNYFVFNLSERPYDNAAFGNRVMECGFPDHFAPPVALCWMVCKTMEGWLSAAPKHVVAVNCLAGKGRTGVVITCYLLFSG